MKIKNVNAFKKLSIIMMNINKNMKILVVGESKLNIICGKVNLKNHFFRLLK